MQEDQKQTLETPPVSLPAHFCGREDQLRAFDGLCLFDLLQQYRGLRDVP